MKFIKLTYIDGTYVLINTAHILVIESGGKTTDVLIVGLNDSVTVTETPEQILEMLA